MVSSLEIKILELKKLLILSELNDLNKWSFIESSIKEIIDYSFNFNIINLNEISNTKLMKILLNLKLNKKSTSLNFINIERILKQFHLNIDDSQKSELKRICENRNNYAHNNLKKESKSSKVIFQIINLLLIEINKILEKYKF